MKSALYFLQTLFSGMLPFTLLMLVGVYFTVKTRFYQFGNLFNSVKLFFSLKQDGQKGITPFKAACNSLAATMGTGNIVGVAAAVALGGAGAVFWMWISALLAMCIKSAEIVAGIKYKKAGSGALGGPMYYIKSKFFARLYAFAGIIGCFFSGNILQTNSAVLYFGLGKEKRILIGIIFALITLAVVTGGVSKISKFTTKAVPVMSIIYVLLCAGVIAVNAKSLPDCFLNIIVGAFNPSAVTGGAVGSIITTFTSGASKGVFSNEAGLGTAAIAYSATDNADIKKQSLYGVFEVFFDTIILCTLTALTILCSGVIIDYGSAETLSVIDAFNSVYGAISQVLLAVMLSLFGIASIIGWAVYGISISSFLFGKKGSKIFTVIYPFFCILGAALNANTVWKAAEFFNGVMLIINLFALLLLSDEITPYLKGN